ncbi:MULTISPECIES: ROK family protein [Bifidobacterium]|uniref:ROK family protein n=1 Tax=Bifidobacterium TaxID=1678 RepID=UPI00101F166E|nr:MULTISPECIES: ROK family protein [Bifidobacterium]MBQ1599261.1 ROK family protein [Bifidobacterium sp.]MBQ1599322.1 ROK family protein [Bifidobacterium sp.]RYQ05247.1 NagC family transcriptional regulator [Bifidobacterium pseudolongum subsp. globosum]RYQ11885.1 NagC family transcriptional regulator [Bifidobacterium pseudolongum subsp. globosum]
MTMQSAGDQQNLSEYNRSRTLQYLYHHGIASRAQIAQALHLTPAALSKISNHLLSSSAIIETGPLEGKGNRRSIGLAVNTGQYRVLGVKFARSLIQIGLFDLAGGAQAVWVDQATDYPTPAEAIDAVKQHIRAIMRQFTNIVAIGMAVPGPYLRSVGHTAVVSSMRQWREVNFKAEFEHAFGVPVIIEQDARAGALAQYLFDPQPHNENLAYYLLGEGIGLGVIDHGSVINGALGTATEIGHVSVDVHGKPCECGNVGCLERYCSAVAIHDLLNEDGTIVPDSPTLTHHEACIALFELAERGDARAQELVRRIGTYVGYGCVTICNAFNPSRIVIGDIVAEAGEPLLERVREVVRERVLPELVESTAIELSTLPTDAAVTGAAAVAIMYILDHPSRFFTPQTVHNATTNHNNQER